MTYGLAGSINTWTQDGVRVGTAHAAHDNVPLRTLVRIDDRFTITVRTKDCRVKVWHWGPGATDGERKRWLFDLSSGAWTQEEDSDLHHVHVWDLEAVRAFAASHVDGEET